MPYFAGLLSAEELYAVVQEVKSFSGVFSRPADLLKSQPQLSARRNVSPAEKPYLRTKAAPRATATPVAAANVSMMDLAIRCLPAISLRHGLSAAARPGHFRCD